MGSAQPEEAELTPTEVLEQKTETLEKAVKTLQKLKISGYIQIQYQYGEKDASLKTGTPNENTEESFSRTGIRRGRIKTVYEEGIASAIFQLDLTEKGIGFKDAYLSIKDPWANTVVLKGGIFDRPFGNEISYSSSRRESPERSTLFQTLFPDERDLGVSLTLQATKTSPWNFLKLEAGLFAGNGIKQETDSRRDFIGHLSVDKNLNSNMKLSGGISYYNGGVYQGTDNIYAMTGDAFILNADPKNKGKFAKREYFGIDAQFSMTSAWGMSQVRAEYLSGDQPGAKTNSKSPNASVLPAYDVYNRNFTGGYVIFVQDFGQLPVSAVLKYDWYDPNTKISGNAIGQKDTGNGDISFHTFGFGLLWRANNNVRLQAYYEINTNETTDNLTAYTNDLKDNVFTMRLQYKF
jgi:hypothetical protein